VTISKNVIIFSVTKHNMAVMDEPPQQP